LKGDLAIFDEKSISLICIVNLCHCVVQDDEKSIQLCLDQNNAYQVVTPRERSRRADLFHSASSGRTRFDIINHTHQSNNSGFGYLMSIAELSAPSGIWVWQVTRQFRRVAVIVI
jgi:hypothetical protein